MLVPALILTPSLLSSLKMFKFTVILLVVATISTISGYRKCIDPPATAIDEDWVS
jgi:hypothetical protein